MVSKIPAIGKHAVTAVSSVVKPEALAVLNEKLDLNIWA